MYLCWEQQLAGQSDLRLQVGVNVFVSERVWKTENTTFHWETFLSASRARWMDSIKLKGGGEKVGHQSRQVTFMSALVIPLIALLDRKWPVWLCFFPQTKMSLQLSSGLDGDSKCLRKMWGDKWNWKDWPSGKKRMTWCVFGMWKCTCNNVLMLLLLTLLAKDHIVVCTCIANFNRLIWPLLSPGIVVVTSAQWLTSQPQ